MSTMAAVFMLLVAVLAPFLFILARVWLESQRRRRRLRAFRSPWGKR